jgi:exodeoxyribonuclease V gamma subunit
VLVGQLRDFLAASWQAASPEPAELEAAGGDPGQVLLQRITLEHPLQPFSRRYFQSGDDSCLYTYAAEWRQAHDSVAVDAVERLSCPTAEEEETLGLAELENFLLRPVRYFFQHSLEIFFEESAALEEDEPFSLNGLVRYGLAAELMEQVLQSESAEVARAVLQGQQERLERIGSLPQGGLGQVQFESCADPVLKTQQRILRLFPDYGAGATFTHGVNLEFTMDSATPLHIVDELRGLRSQNGEGWLNLLAFPEVLKKSEALHWQRLLRSWVGHLAGCASGLSLTTLLVGPDRSLQLAPLNGEQARKHLQDILLARQEGLRHPLPLACRSAFAYLDANSQDRAADAAAQSYHGNQGRAGEVDYDPYLGRAYPDFASLWGEGEEFQRWTALLYAPFKNWLTPHGEDGP